METNNEINHGDFDGDDITVPEIPDIPQLDMGTVSRDTKAIAEEHRKRQIKMEKHQDYLNKKEKSEIHFRKRLLDSMEERNNILADIRTLLQIMAERFLEDELDEEDDLVDEDFEYEPEEYPGNIYQDTRKFSSKKSQNLQRLK